MPSKKSVGKSLDGTDESGTLFMQDMYRGADIYGINIDVQFLNHEIDRFVLIELLKCDEQQFIKGVTPQTSHPNKYFYKNRGKWLALEAYRQSLRRPENNLPALVYLVNYSEPGTLYGEEVKLMELIKVNSKYDLPVVTHTIPGIDTRAKLRVWVQTLVSKCRCDLDQFNNILN